MKQKSVIAVAVLGFVACVTTAWLAMGAPSSLAEARFYHRLANATSTSKAALDLSALMPGEWELVCSAHCYDGPLYLKKYDRKFPAVSACQDGSWGLIFISSNGSYTSAAGDCRSSSVEMNLDRCLPRGNANLQPYRDRGGCLEYRNREHRRNHGG
jgi:hypothetical protein